VERAEHVERALKDEETSESVRLPQSEPPGPFVAADDDDTPPALPLQKSARWALVLPAVLVAAAALAVVRGIAPHGTAPRIAVAAAAAAPQAKDGEPPLSETSLSEASLGETNAVSLPETPALESQVAPAIEPTPGPLLRKAAWLDKPLALTLPIGNKRSEGSDATHGTLDITSSSSAGVVLDGRPLGKAPRVVKVAPGLHTVVFIHPERGRMLVNVNVNAGQTTRASAGF
jgi:hypothetical protein